MSHPHTAETIAPSTADGCPVLHDASPMGGAASDRWWPERLNLRVLAKNPAVANPRGADFDDADAFAARDLAEAR